MDWIFFAFLTAVLVAASAITQKKALFKEHAMEFSATLSILSLIVAAPLFISIDWVRLEMFSLFILFFASMFEALAFLLIAKAMRHMGVSDMSPLLVMTPVFTALFAFIFLGESITLFQVAGLLLLILGSYVLELKRESDLLGPFKIFKQSKYLKLVFLAMILYGLTSTLDRLLLGTYKMQPEAYIAFFHLFIAIQFMIMLWVFFDGIKGVKNGLKNAGGWILIVALFTVGYRLAQSFAISEAKVALVSAIKRTSALFAVVIGGELFHEKNLFRKTIACLIMIAGVFMIVL